MIHPMRRDLPSPSEARAILDRRRARPTPGPPPGAGKALTATMKALEARFGQGADGLQGRWREIVGETLARRTEPVRLIRTRGGGPAALELRVDGPSATLIQHQARDLLARVNLFLGESAVDRLRIVQGPVRARPARDGAANGPKRPRRELEAPLDAAAEAALEHGLDDLAEGPLRAALTRLGRAVLRREGAKD
jgi:hypothetical protein